MPESYVVPSPYDDDEVELPLMPRDGKPYICVPEEQWAALQSQVVALERERDEARAQIAGLHAVLSEVRDSDLVAWGGGPCGWPEGPKEHAEECDDPETCAKLHRVWNILASTAEAADLARGDILRAIFGPDGPANRVSKSEAERDTLSASLASARERVATLRGALVKAEKRCEENAKRAQEWPGEYGNGLRTAYEASAEEVRALLDELEREGK